MGLSGLPQLFAVVFADPFQGSLELAVIGDATAHEEDLIGS